jgi:peptidoglycan/LPS O-acetylase OafA/YrhL
MTSCTARSFDGAGAPFALPPPVVPSRLGRDVDLFFVPSGFLISSLLFSEYKRYGRIDVKRFWIRRAFKIYPAFLTGFSED